MSNFKAGQRVRVVGDSFPIDPHGLPVGSVFKIESVHPSEHFNDFPPFVKFIYAKLGHTDFTIPERVHVKTGVSATAYANIPTEDVELVASEGSQVRMTEDDWSDGYRAGDVFETFEDDGELYFYDNDGDIRPLDSHPHTLV